MRELLTKYEAEMQEAERRLLRLQGAVAALRQVVEQTEKQDEEGEE